MALFENLRTVDQIVKKNPAFTEGGIRWLIFNAGSNGLADAIVRIGGPDSKRPKVLIDEPKFDRWLESRRGSR